MILKASILSAVLAQNGQLAHTFAERMTYVATPAPATSRTQVPRLAGTVRPTYIYKSFAAFASDLASGRLPGSVHAVEYDVEKWAATPLVEQQSPRAYMARFSALARAHGLLPILAPARDLVLVPGGSCVKQVGENLSEAYIRCGLAEADAQASALVVQSQVDEFVVPAFHHFLAVVARQARAGNPRIAVLAQLATAPLGRAASVAQLVAAARSVGGLVPGFSLTARSADIQTTAGLLWAFGQA
jgi:hypothetical protein